jgi:agmatine deiminase
VSCFVRARYDPEYADTAHSRAVQSGFTRFLGRSWSAAGARHPMRKLDLILEGGNVCHNGRGGLIVTEKVLLRNRLVGAADLTAMLRTAVHVDRLGVVPVEPDDPIGHADGMVRWVDPHRLVVNDYANQPDPRYKRFSHKLSASLEEAFGNRKIITAPYPLPRLNLATPLDATGNYLNFLMTGNKLYLPAYGIPEDEEARAVLSNSCGAQISSVEATSLAREGGVLNCITWCFKSSAIDHMGSVRPSR